jgi:hypothetical protein
MKQLDTENADRNLTSIVTVLTHTPDASNPTLCQGLVLLGDGTKNLDGTGGSFELTVTVGGQTVQPNPQTVTFSTAVRSMVFTSVFPVPANAEVLLRVKSPNGADTDVDVTAYLYDVGALQPTTAARTLDVTTGGCAGIDWANVESPTTSVGLTSTTIATTQKVDLETIKTRAVTCDAGVTVLASVGTAATSTAQTGDVYALASGDHGFVSIQDDIDAILLDTGTDGVKLAAGAINNASLAENMEIVFETDFATNYNTTRDMWQVDVAKWLGGTVATPTVTGVPEVDITHVNGSAASLGTAQTGDAYARLGAPAGASVSADIAAVKVDTQAVETAVLTDGVLLADGAITDPKIASNAITASKIAASAITSSKFATGAITATVIADAAIDNATFAADVGSTAYATNIIALAVRKVLDELNLDHLMKVAVASGADMTTEVADGTVLSNLLTATGDTSDYDRSTDSLENQYDTSAWTLNTVTATGVVLADNAIAAAKIATGAITAAKFAAGAINDAAIATDAITAAKIAANAISASKIATDAITSTKIAANAITATTIADGAIDADTFASDALAAIESECNDALVALNLDHLMKTAVASGVDMTTEVADGTVLSNLMTATGDTSDYVRSTDSLEVAGDTTTAIKATTDKLDSMVEEIT